MKIIQVCSADESSSGDRHVKDLTRAMQERGHSMYLAAPPASLLFNEMKERGVSVHEFELRNSLDILNAHRLAKIIRDEQIDVMHVHTERDYMFSGIAARLVPVKFFITQHQSTDIAYNPFYPWALHHARVLIGVSEAIKQRLVASFPQFTDRMLVIPNWLDSLSTNALPKTIARKKLGITKRLAVAMIGQLTPLKRQDLFIRAAASLINERDWRDVEFMVVGMPGHLDKEYAEHLYKLPDSFGVRDKIKIMGNINKLPTLMSAFDIVVMPPEDGGFPLTMIEAMAAGCAIISSDVGGGNDVIEHGYTSLLVDHRNLGSLVAAISKLLVDKPLRDKLGSQAKSSVVERYERESVISRIENLYFEDL